MKLYKQLADDVTVLIRQGALKPGDRVPSVRATTRERGMSAATVIRPPVEPGQRTGDKGPRRHRAIIDAAPEERLRLSSSG